MLPNTNNAQATAVISFIDIWIGNSGLILNKDCKFSENLENYFFSVDESLDKFQ